MMQRIKDITGQTFGYLTAIEPTERRLGASVVWLCTCSCGEPFCPNEVYVATQHLCNGSTKSCLRQRYKTNRSRALVWYYKKVIMGARTRGYLFDLTFEQFHDLIRNACHYCGDKDTRQVQINSRITCLLKANGIDRVNSNLAYTVNNCVPCCSKCNYAKHTMSKQEYIDHCKRVANYQESKKYDGN